MGSIFSSLCYSARALFRDCTNRRFRIWTACFCCKERSWALRRSLFAYCVDSGSIKRTSENTASSEPLANESPSWPVWTPLAWISISVDFWTQTRPFAFWGPKSDSAALLGSETSLDGTDVELRSLIIAVFKFFLSILKIGWLFINLSSARTIWLVCYLYHKS